MQEISSLSTIVCLERMGVTRFQCGGEAAWLQEEISAVVIRDVQVKSGMLDCRWFQRWCLRDGGLAPNGSGWRSVGEWLRFGLEWFWEVWMLTGESDVTEVVDCCENSKRKTWLLEHVSASCWGSIFYHYNMPSNCRASFDVRHMSSTGHDSL